MYKRGQIVEYIGDCQSYKRFFKRYNADYRRLKIIEVMDNEGLYQVGTSKKVSLFFSKEVIKIAKNNIKKL